MADYLLRSATVEVAVSDHGATLKSVVTPDRYGVRAEITRGGITYAGATCGRFANRLAGGQFELDGVRYQVTQNEGSNQLHGGASGFDLKAWEARPYSDGDRDGVELTLTSPDGDEGYPGELQVSVSYWIDQTDTLGIDFKATTDATTVLNLTNHAYWNLGDADSQALSDHNLQLGASSYVAVNKALIPTGELLGVQDSVFDLTAGRSLTESYDHCFVLDQPLTDSPAAVLSNLKSGRIMKVHTDQPGLQVYTADHNHRFGVALEAQGFPDAPNHSNFPSAVLRPGEVYSRQIRIQFGTN